MKSLSAPLDPGAHASGPCFQAGLRSLLSELGHAFGHRRLPSADTLIAFAVLIVFALPPLDVRLGSRSTSLFPAEFLAGVSLPIALWRAGRLPRSPVTLTLAIYSLACLPSIIGVEDLPRWLHGFSVPLVGCALLVALQAAALPRAQLMQLTRWSPLPYLVLASAIIVHHIASGQLLLPGTPKITLAWGGSNYLASILLLGAFVPLSRVLSGRAHTTLGWELASFATISAAIILTGSRTAILLLPVGALMTVFQWWRTRRRRIAAPLIAAVLVSASVLLAVQPYLENLEQRGRFERLLEQRNLVLRFMLFELYGDAFRQQPWTGVGMSNVRVTPVLSLLGEGKSSTWGGHSLAHNWLLQTLGDTGLVGTAGFVIFLVAAARLLRRGARHGPMQWRATVTGWWIGFAIASVHGLLEPNFHGKGFFLLLALTLGLASELERHATPRGTVLATVNQETS